MDRRLIKHEAKIALEGNRLMFLLVILVAGAISSVVPPLAVLVSPIIMMGVFLVGKHLLKEKEVQFEPIFAYFKDIEHGFKIFVVSLLVNIFVVIGLVLFIVPGIIFALKYSQAAFLMSEDKNLDIMEALKKSGEMMDGYKMNLFLFGLSFIGHILLGILTLGLYLLYALPYILLSYHNYYLNLKVVRGYDKKAIDA